MKPQGLKEKGKRDMTSAIVAAAVVVIVLAGVAAYFYRRAVLRARKARAEIAAAKASGKCVLYCAASRLTLNGEESEDRPQVAANKERGLIMDPGHYDSVGTFAIRDDDGKLIATFTDAELSFTLKAGREYELGVFLFDPEILGLAVSHRQLGPSGSGQGILALACVAC